ncbi:MAG: YigZ family protein [Caloramator sp.]|nr:YigZ family protein [Caloramator sp.]
MIILNKEYFTVLNQVEVSFEEKKSIFICNIKRVENENEAMEFINKIKEKYKDATHNVYAYITNNKISMRYSDDGEPQGTAGPPVLEVLKREGLNDVAAVITRYFGGTLLGASGLIRAYGTSCKMGVDAAKKVKRLEGCVFEMNFDYDKYGKIQNYFQKKNIVINNSEFLEKVYLNITCLKQDFDEIKSDMIELMNGINICSLKYDIMCYVDDENKIMEV